MKLASWNINSIRKRYPLVVKWIEKEKPDWLFLQEIKCQNEQFPKESFESLGYHCIVHGQKAYNGVAILSKHAYTLNSTKLPTLTEEAEEARYLEIESKNLTLCNLYLPNGNSGGEAGLLKKVKFCQALYNRAKDLLNEKQNCIFAGDFNICPNTMDYATNALSLSDALVRPEIRDNFYKLLWLGLTDALRTFYPTQTIYTFWDYQHNAWARNSGLRIDHILISPRLAERLQDVIVDKNEREKNQPSDHVPVVVNF